MLNKEPRVIPIATMTWTTILLHVWSVLFDVLTRVSSLSLRPVFRCGGDLVAESGFVGSESFPSPYKPNSKCTWHVTVSHHSTCLNVDFFLPQSSESDSYTISLVSRSQREMWSSSPSASLTWRLTHSVDTIIWMFTMAIPTWCKKWVVFVELSGLVLLFQPQTP